MTPFQRLSTRDRDELVVSPVRKRGEACGVPVSPDSGADAARACHATVPPMIHALTLSPLVASQPARKGDRVEVSLDPVALGDGVEHFKPERLYVSSPASWTICSVVIDGRAQLDQELAGALFAPDARAAGRWLDTIRRDSKISLSAVCESDVDRGFHAALVGFPVPTSASVPSCPSIPELSNNPRAFSGPIRFRDHATGEPVWATVDGPERVLPGESAWFIARPQCVALRVEQIVIDLASAEWEIEDIHVHGKSQFAQVGAIPGEMFSPDAVDNFVAFNTVQTAMNFAIKATYRGKNLRGRFFGATCLCKVVR